ncbi:MAG: acyl-CoA thioesterase II [Acidimicrobiia bacterium]|nr:MAG: acyl-CoA thioesterase II [Acidimicrobiia bacterium]
MGTALDELISLLQLEQLEVNLFRGLSPDENRQRVFGGQVAGQALVAAGRTVDHGDVHSLHAYFLRPGDPRVPIVYEVDRIRDGRSFTTRRVVAIQHGRAIFNLSASFHVREPGPEHQYTMPEAPDPETLPTVAQRLAGHEDRFPPDMLDWLRRERPIETRSPTLPRWLDPEPGTREPEQLVWIRANGSLPDDPLLHACVVAYASDLTLLDTAVMAHANSWDDDRFMIASLDHAMWFHRPMRADEWLLYHQKSPSAQAARGLAEGFIYRRDGALAVTVIQEGLIRPVKPNWQSP